MNANPSLYLTIASVLVCGLAQAQQQSAPIPPLEQTVIVLGSPQPITLDESSRSVVVLLPEHSLSVSIPEDLMRTDSSLLVEQRGAGGAQADISMRGSSFEQTLVLLNGLRINDAQTAHHNLDLPVPLEAFDSIEVLHGAGSTLYGSDALGGVVDFLTRTPAGTSLRLRSGIGSYGENEESLLANLAGERRSQVLALDRNLSTGFVPDRDYRNEDGSSETRVKTTLGLTDLLFAASDRAFGADQFYGPYNSWERTKGWFASANQELGAKTEAAFGYRRHTDNFILLRNDPSFYANNHIDSSWQSVLRRKKEFGRLGVLFLGLEGEGDAIESNNLGRHTRNHGAGYIDFDLHPPKRWSLNAGLREEILSGGREVLSPDLGASVRVSDNLKLRASSGYGFRLPTYTDLYYSDPTTTGNADLRPESVWSADIGLDWFRGRALSGSLTVFYSRQHDAIDYVRLDASHPWQATNLSGLRFAGIEGTLNWAPMRGQHVRLGWTAITGAERALHGLESEYVFNYPVLNANAEWSLTPKKGYFLRTRIEVVERYHRDPYPVWDFEAAREKGMLHPYLRVKNLSNTGYEEIEGVRMPPRSFEGGFAWSFSKGNRRKDDLGRMGR